MNGGFYVSMIREAGTKAQRVALLAGPFDTHDEALALVDRATNLAFEVDPWSGFDAFGTVRMKDEYRKPGVLNARLGIATRGEANV